MQRKLDIFDDSREAVLRNDPAQAVLNGDPVAARQTAETLQTEFGADPMLAPATVPIEHLH